MIRYFFRLAKFEPLQTLQQAVSEETACLSKYEQLD